MKNNILAIAAATIWISLSEFARNEYLLKTNWIKHYEDLGLIFPSQPVNGAVWGIWSLCVAIFIFILSRKFSFVQTSLIAWFASFVLMWLVIGNMDVLPFSIIPFAIPLSLLEAFVASFIIHKLSKK